MSRRALLRMSGRWLEVASANDLQSPNTLPHPPATPAERVQQPTVVTRRAHQSVNGPSVTRRAFSRAANPRWSTRLPSR